MNRSKDNYQTLASQLKRLKVEEATDIYLYKTKSGLTKAIPFFKIPSLAEKLKVMGPGEAFVDTNLTLLAKEIAGLNGKGR